MTIRIPLLLAALLATRGAPARPQSAPVQTSASDQARVDGAMSQAVAAYRSLRSYSGRFASADPLYDQSQTGTLQFERPNRVAMLVQVKESRSPYTRRVVSDGKFVWTTDSRFKNRYTKEKVGRFGDAMSNTIGRASGGNWTDLCRFLNSNTPMDGYPMFRVTSRPGAPVLALDASTVTEPNEKPMPQKLTFRFGGDSLLRASTQKRGPLGYKFERHWNIKLNPKLPATTFQFKPAPGSREIEEFERSA